MTKAQLSQLRRLVANMGAAASAYKEYAREWKKPGHADPFKSTRVKDFERAFEDGKDLLNEIESVRKNPAT